MITSNKPQKLTSLTYEKHLSHDMFVDNSPAIIMSIQQQLQTQPLNQTDTNYLNSLKFSLLYETLVNISMKPIFLLEKRILLFGVIMIGDS